MADVDAQGKSQLQKSARKSDDAEDLTRAIEHKPENADNRNSFQREAFARRGSSALLRASFYLKKNSAFFEVNQATLSKLSDEQDEGKQIHALGGVAGVCALLKTHPETGLMGVLSPEDFENELFIRKKIFGENVIPEPPKKTYLQLLMETLKDTTMIILCIAAIVSLGVSFVQGGDPNPCDDFEPNNPIGKKSTEGHSSEFLESIAILVAVGIVANVTALNDYSKEKQFRKLNEASRNTSFMQVIRRGKRSDVLAAELVVGDVLILTAGDRVPADGIFISGHNFHCDESALTGEPDLQPKLPGVYMKDGALVNEGYGTMLVTAVGEHSDSGKAQVALGSEPQEETPLQHKLDKMATLIGKVGLGMAVLMYVSVVIRFIICRAQVEGYAWKYEELQILLNFLILGITIVVVAVPEGLPLAVTISLAYSMKKMMKDQNLVRKLAACETMGGATNICSDKTGTLTENRMTVTEGVLLSQLVKPIPNRSELKGTEEQLDVLIEGLAINTQDASFIQLSEQGTWDYKGNKTECSILVMCESLGGKFIDIREKIVSKNNRLRSLTFSSDRKRMTSVILTEDNRLRVHTKGAAEIVIELCKDVISETGEVLPLKDEMREKFLRHINSFTSQGLRTLCIGYRMLDYPQEVPNIREYVDKLADTDIETGLTLLALVGIKDPVRAAVPSAVQQCKKAGIFVRMVTGDNIETAKHIARECGIYDDTGVALEGSVFREMSDEQLNAILPKLQVLARSKPTDKYILVQKLKRMGEVVAVTGDGTNDAPALKEADVGLAMGITGTEVAKKASDMIILDDNFLSIVKAVMWGRNVYDSIKKFLQFQLTVNVCALIIAYVGAVSDSRSPLSPVQLLWVNLIMDTFAALALATERPSIHLLERLPYGRFDSLVSDRMWTDILGQAAAQVIILLSLLFAGPQIVGPEDGNDKDTIETMIFNTFVFLQLFNEVNSRRLDTHWNIFENIFDNPLFLIIMAGTILMQSLIVEFGGEFFQCSPLNARCYFICVGLGSLAWPWGFVMKRVEFPVNKYVFRITNKSTHTTKTEAAIELREVPK